ncbi:hypothetical protein [Ilumatobacter sp.]|uniref:hypothetical protein n=1 Tax=Ilumatobacter sp. TaxID=1967498 RepID=UPI003C333066
MSEPDTVMGPIEGATHQSFAGMEIDVMSAGPVRIKRLVYGVGGRWSEHVKPHVGTDFCMHAHVGFIAQGRLAGEYPDGCTFDFVAPQAVCIEPGHDSWVIGDEPVVLIQFDFENDTLERLGMPDSHQH